MSEHDPIKDLRGARDRFVQRGDSVTISGEEYLKKSRRAHDAEWLERELDALRATLRRNHMPSRGEGLQAHFEERRDYAIREWGKAQDREKALEAKLKRAHDALDAAHEHTPETWQDREPDSTPVEEIDPLSPTDPLHVENERLRDKNTELVDLLDQLAKVNDRLLKRNDNIAAFLDSFHQIFANVSDTFGYACADSERIILLEETNTPKLVEMWTMFGHTGIVAYVAKMRDKQPVKEARTLEFERALAYLAGWEYEED